MLHLPFRGRGARLRHRKCHITKILGSQSQIAGCAIDVAVAEEISDRFNRRATTQQMHSVGVPETMCAKEGDLQSASSRPPFEDHRYAGRFERFNRRPTPQEQVPRSDILRASFAQIVHQCGPHSVCQWQR